MRLQVLVSTMYQTDYSLLDKMNICSDAIVVNQCNNDSRAEFMYCGRHIIWINSTGRGIGVSRNTAIINSTADIILFADDDVIYDDDYVSKVIGEFEEHPHYSIITYNLQSQNPDRPEFIVDKSLKMNRYNCLKYGAFRIAVKRNKLLYKNIFFSLLFGGGARHSAGEDNLFIVQCLRHGMKGMASEKKIGSVEQKQSTWFKGYNEKYYFDRGVLMYLMYGEMSRIFIKILNSRTRPNETLSKKVRAEKSLEGIRYCKNTVRKNGIGNK